MHSLVLGTIPQSRTALHNVLTLEKVLLFLGRKFTICQTICYYFFHLETIEAV